MEILRERAMYGFVSNVIDDNLLGVVAKGCKGDTRVALQMLKIAPQEAAIEIRRITIEEILAGVRSWFKYRLSYLLGKLNYEQRLIYQILKEKGTMVSRRLFDELQRGTNAELVDRTYRNYRDRMEELGLVRGEGVGKWKDHELSS